MALVCSACAQKLTIRTYPGPELPPDQVATLSGARHLMFWLFYNRTTWIRILSVDEHHAEPAADEWLLLPGRHTAHTAYRVNHFILGPGSAWASVTQRARLKSVPFTSQPGHRYRADGRIIDVEGAPSEYCAWIEDAETGEVVGGSKDPTPTPAAGPLPPEKLRPQ